MQVVVSCDFLVSPAFCDAGSFAEKIGDLIAIKREMEDGKRVLIESNSISKLSDLKCYPCVPLFKNNIPRELMAEFSARDIAKVVHNIASMTVHEDCLLPECVADWRVKEVAPVLQGFNHERLQAISQLVEDVSLACYFHERLLSILHHPLEDDVSSIKVSGEIENSIPVFDTPPPLTLESHIPVYSGYQKFLLQFNSYQEYCSAISVNQIVAAISLGAATIAQSVGKSEINKFRLGFKFVETLRTHQCGPGQRFSGAAFDAICHVVAGVVKSPHNPMYSNLNKKEQKISGEKLAWRTHVTTGNPALRLMYWTEGDVVELANVGNKKALEIF